MLDPSDPSEWCAEASRACDEPIAGTATEQTSVWIALEYAGPWGRKALKTSGLAPEVRAHLAAWNDRVPRSRVQLIKRDPARADAASRTVTLFVALVDPRAPALYRVDLPSADAARSFDLDAVLRRAPSAARHRVDESIVLVCTNGQRDRCCAKFGLPVYRRFAALAPARAWETTHIGGHRFAATLVVLPEGIVYGRLDPDEVEACLRAHDRGELHAIERLRGRSCHSKSAQIAESLLRERLGDHRLDSLIVEDEQLTPLADNRHRARVRFRDLEGRAHVVEYVSEPQPVVRPKGCGEPPQPIRRIRLGA